MDGPDGPKVTFASAGEAGGSGKYVSVCRRGRRVQDSTFASAGEAESGWKARTLEVKRRAQGPTVVAAMRDKARSRLPKT